MGTDLGMLSATQGHRAAAPEVLEQGAELERRGGPGAQIELRLHKFTQVGI